MSNYLLLKLLSIPGVIFVFSFKGFAQAFVAKKLGDDTPERDGKLTLNPMAHIDIIGFLFILLIGIGWCKPVRTNSHNYKNLKRDSAIQILSGPVGLIVCGFIFAFLTSLTLFLSQFMLKMSFYKIIAYLIIIFESGMSISLSLAVFYLLPLPGLDGYNFIVNFLPYKYYRKLYTIEKYSSLIFFIFIILIEFTGVLDILFVPANMMMNGFTLFWNMIFNLF